jgi:hypothetical protein
MSRINHLNSFYDLLGSLTNRLGGAKLLANCNGRMPWPRRGVYFFFEPGEIRDGSARQRVVRVGSHALTPISKTTLWNRLSQHKGTAASGSGNHRGSVFRLLVGASLLARSKRECPTWGVGRTENRIVRETELEIEKEVSQFIGKMPFVCLEVDSSADDHAARGYVERNAIALLTNFQRPPLDAASSSWLGNFCPSAKVRLSGLWNQNHVEEEHDPAFLDDMARLVQKAA